LSDILTCVRVLAESVASLPLDLYIRTERGGEKDRDHSLQELIRWQPNPEMTSYDFRLWLMVDALLRGNGAAQVIRDGNGQVLELWPLYSAKLKAVRGKGGDVMYQYPSPDKKGEHVSLKSDEVLLIKSFGSGSLFSPSLVTLAADLLSGAKGAEDYTREFFANGTTLSGVIEFPEEMGEEAFERLKKDWEDAHTGDGNRHKTPILEGGGKFNPLALNHQESQMIESRKFTRSQIAGLLRVPAHLINDLEKATFSNIEHQDLGFVKHTLRPWMANFEQRLRMTLLSADEKKTHYFRHNTNDLLRGDLKSRYDAYGIGVQNGFLSPNEVKKKEDEPTYDGGDTHFINSASVPVDVATKAQPKDYK
jgi:HK97 family phage portal protein